MLGCCGRECGLLVSLSAASTVLTTWNHCPTVRSGLQADQGEGEPILEVGGTVELVRSATRKQRGLVMMQTKGSRAGGDS